MGLGSVGAAAAYLDGLNAARTRFIPKSVLPHFEHVTWPKAGPADVRTGVVRNVRIDVGARLLGLWQ